MLFTQAETLDDFVVFLAVIILQVSQQLASLADQLEQTSAGMVILPMDLEMLCEEVDSLRQKRYLNRRRAGIGPMYFKIANEFLFLIFNFWHLCRNHFLFLTIPRLQSPCKAKITLPLKIDFASVRHSINNDFSIGWPNSTQNPIVSAAPGAGPFQPALEQLSLLRISRYLLKIFFELQAHRGIQFANLFPGGGGKFERPNHPRDFVFLRG